MHWMKEHTIIANEWMNNSDYICILESENLNQLIEKVLINDIGFSIFREPDLDNEITAIALSPCDKSKKICSNLKLALSD